MDEQNTKPLEGIMNQQFWSFDQIVEVAICHHFENECSNKEQYEHEVLLFKVNLTEALLKDIRGGRITQIKVSKKGKFYDPDNPIHETLFEFSRMAFPFVFLVLFYFLIKATPAELNTSGLTPSLGAFFVVASMAGVCFMIAPLTGLFLLAKKCLAKTLGQRLEYLQDLTTIYGVQDGLFDSDSAINYLNQSYNLNIPRDPFRVWPEPFFKRNGEMWIIGFEGKNFPLRVDKGTHDTYERIAYLLQNPDKDFSCMELAYKFHGDIKLEAEAGDIKEGKVDYSQEPAFAKATHVQLIELKGVLKEQIMDATERDELFENVIKDDDSSMELEKLKKQHKEISNYLIETYDKNGRERGPRSQQSKAQETVRKGINRFKGKARKFHPELAEHLDISISYGKGRVAYRPLEEIVWDIQS